MKTLLLSLGLLLVTIQLSGQNLAGEYFIQGQGGELVLRLQNAGGNQITGTLVDMQGVTYQVQAEDEEGDAFGTLTSQTGSIYFEAFREGDVLWFTLIPAGQDGNPDPSGAQEFEMSYRGSGNQGSRGSFTQRPVNPEMQNSTQQQQATTYYPGPESPWNGTFSGSIMNTPSTMTIQVGGGQLSGNVNASGYVYNLSGSVNGYTSQGQMTDPQAGGGLNYQASLNGDQLAFTLINPMNGQSQQFQLSRGAANIQQGGGMNGMGNADAGAQNVERDQRIIGTWTWTDSYNSYDYSFATQYKMIVNADGTYLYGDGKVVGGGPGISGSSEGGDVVQGQWRTQNGIIYINTGRGWQAYCQYTTDGQSLLMKFGGDDKQLWKRAY